MRLRGRNLRDRKILDLIERQGSITRKALVLWCDLSGLVRELPGRVSQHGREAPLSDEA
jgi:hypothetical protein